MKQILLSLLVLSSAAVFCQSSKTYAVVVGISTYSSPGIPQLAFAHKDAMVFADYLTSKAGGQVPQENIRLLLNENATYAAIYDALDWLLNTCQKNDLVYFYFSGHGDMENSTMYKLGFLLSYNTPRTNYINNAVRIEDVNNIANTLSVKVNAKVVLLTDACHSGNLAGSDFRGSLLAGEELRAVQSKEIRISSCAPDQLSAEDEGWGGGRGVFSFYLVDGLSGLADANHDKIITVNEIKNYLDASLATDALLVQKGMKQSPVVKGSSLFQLASVDQSTQDALQKQSAGMIASQQGRSPIVAGALKPLPPQPQAWVFNLLQRVNPEALFNFAELNKLPRTAIPQAALRMLADSVKAHASIQEFVKDTQYFSTYKMELLQQTLNSNKDAVARFNNKLAVALSDRGQEIINKYLEGDAAELERMRYYNSNSSGYDVYPDMFAVAINLTEPSNYLYHLLQIKLHYFSGVAARIKIPTVQDPRSLIAFALSEQQKAFQLEENAAYIQNELGALFLLSNNLGEAETKLKRASQIAPKWAIPHANLAALYINKKDFEQANTEIKTAISLQPDLQASYILSGFINEQRHFLLQAEEFFWKSIYLNSRHYLPFERLGFVYMSTTQYKKADSCLYEADKRKKGYHFTPGLPKVLPPFIVPFNAVEVPCTIDSAAVAKDDAMGIFALGIQAYNTGKDADAERRFKEVIRIDKSNPLAYHYLGKLLYAQQRWQEGAIIFKLAIVYQLDTTAFNAYAANLVKKLRQTKSKDCIVKVFLGNRYNGIDDYYFAGRLYEKWNHFTEAEAQYRQIIALQPLGTGGYYLLWNMLEKVARYNDAEDVLKSFVTVNMGRGEPELAGFYRRMIARFPGNGDYYYKAGRVFYFISARDPQQYPGDKKQLLPDSHAEVYETVYTSPSRIMNDGDNLIPGILEAILVAQDIIRPLSDGIDMLQKADSLLTYDNDALADINYKIGDLYVWQGIATKAVPYYHKSLGLQPHNANTRLQLIGIYDTTYQFTAAMVQLDSLYSRREIDFDKQLLMAKYYIHETRFEEAAELLQDAARIHPYQIDTIADLNGRLNWLSGKPKQALVFYKEYLALHPGDAQALYTIARIYAKMGNSTEAWKWLEMAMTKGFNYSWVLQLDDVWDKYRKDSRWAFLQKRFPAKEYINTDL